MTQKTEKKVVEGNKAIAEFMQCDRRRAFFSSWFADNSLQYHTSWDWLMPACKKAVMYVKVDSTGHYYQNEIVHKLAVFEMEQAWEALVNYIQWYNSNK